MGEPPIVVFRLPTFFSDARVGRSLAACPLAHTLPPSAWRILHLLKAQQWGIRNHLFNRETNHRKISRSASTPAAAGQSHARPPRKGSVALAAETPWYILPACLTKRTKAKSTLYHHWSWSALKKEPAQLPNKQVTRHPDSLCSMRSIQHPHDTHNFRRRRRVSSIPRIARRYFIVRAR